MLKRQKRKLNNDQYIQSDIYYPIWDKIENGDNNILSKKDIIIENKNIDCNNKNIDIDSDTNSVNSEKSIYL
jgi:hypothetical protein